MIGDKEKAEEIETCISDKVNTLVCLMGYLWGDERDDKFFDKLEDFYLTNYERGVLFALAFELPQGERRMAEREASLKNYAEKRICSLSVKYGNHFALFLRKRRRFVNRKVYKGADDWEYVRELCCFLRGRPNKLQLIQYDPKEICRVKYLVMLEENISLHPSAVHGLAEVMRSPENIPVMDSDRAVVTSGHAFIQPRRITVSSFDTAFSDIVENVCDDIGRYSANGILDVDAFLSVSDMFSDACGILLYDFLNGAVASDIVVSVEVPQNAISFYIQKERVMREGVQMIPHLFRSVGKTHEDRMKLSLLKISKYKIFYHLARLSMPCFFLTVLFFSTVMDGAASFVSVVFALAILLLGNPRGFRLKWERNGWRALPRSLSVFVFSVSTVAFEAVLFAKNLAGAFYRLVLGYKNTANSDISYEHLSAKQGCLDDYILRFSPSMMIGLLFVCLPNAIGRIFGVFWMGMPIVFWYLSREKKQETALCESDKRALCRYTRDAWTFFRDHVNTKTNGLPPNGINFSPRFYISPKTSPRDIGLYYLSLLAARDFGYIDSDELYRRCDLTTQTVKNLFKWNGHLYRWYHTATLKVFGEAFVSTAESGVLVASLLTFCEGAKEYAGDAPKLLDVISSLEGIIEEMDFSALYDKENSLFYDGYHVSLGKYTDEQQKNFMSEERLASYYAVSKHLVPYEHYYKMSRDVIGRRGRLGIASRCGTVTEYFMPSLFLPIPKKSIFPVAYFHVFKEQKRCAVKRTVLGKKQCLFGISDGEYFSFDGEMHYQYGNFGLESLSCDLAVRTEDVVTPYASFFMLETASEHVMENLRRLESLGMYGRYGFYEAMDFELSRVGKGYACIQSVISSHLGVCMISAANLLMGGGFRSRFLQNPSMRAHRELLSEKMPTSPCLHTVKKSGIKIAMATKAVCTKTENAQEYEHTLLHPNVAMVTNHHMKLLASSSGHIAIEYGEKMLCFSDFDLYDLGRGLRVYVNIDGTVFPTVPLMGEADGFFSSFSFVAKADKIVYHSSHTDRKRTFTIALTLWVSPDKSLCGIACDVGGVFGKVSAFLCFEPVMSERRRRNSFGNASDQEWESEYDEEGGVLLFRKRKENSFFESEFLGVTASPSLKKDFFDTLRENVLSFSPNESDYRGFAEKEALSDSMGKTDFPLCAIRSAAVGFGKGRIAFTMGVSHDADDLLYWLTDTTEEGRRLRRLKTADLLNLQYGAAGLSVSVLPLEHFILRSMAFGQIRPRVEHFRRIDRGAFERFWITGENPMVLAVKFSDDEERISRLRELIGLFKYMCIRGVRYDFVIFYKEDPNHEKNNRAMIMNEICRSGCEGFLSWACGIFLINEDMLTPGERFGYEVSAAAVFDLSVSSFALASENARAIPISAETEALLKAEITTRPHTDETSVQKPRDNVYVLSSKNLGAVLTENSLGFTFFRDKLPGKLTPHTEILGAEDRGERLILRIYGMFDGKRYRDYDLCAVSSRVEYTVSSVKYYGTIDDIRFSVSVALSEINDVKKSEITLECEKSLRAALVYFVSPALGEKIEQSRFYRFRKEKDCIRIVRFTDHDMRNGELIVFSPDATTMYTDTAAFRSDGRIFRGESDAAILFSRMELCGKRVIRCYLSVVFSESAEISFEKLGDF